MKTIVAPDNRCQTSGDPEPIAGGVIINNTIFMVPPFVIVDGAPDGVPSSFDYIDGAFVPVPEVVDAPV